MFSGGCLGVACSVGGGGMSGGGMFLLGGHVSRGVACSVGTFHGRGVAYP